MKLIDADKLLEALGVFTDKEHGDPHFLNGIEAAREIVEGMPEAVARCKDCAKSRPDGNDESVWLWCRRVHGLTRKNDFCPYGERRSDETDLCRNGTRDARSI